MGPRAFEPGETIYGRSHEIGELRDVLIARRIVLLYSPSGAGKSSLLEAGLRPALADDGFEVLPTIRVGAEPPGELAAQPIHNRYVLSTVLSLEEGRPADLQLSRPELATVDLNSYLDRLLDDRDAGAERCLFFDQLEELFTLDPTDVAAKRTFLSELGVALRDRGRWAVLAMREDFIAQLDPYLGLLPTRLASRYRLDLLDPTAAKLAAQRPAADHDVAFANAAADRLIDDLRRVHVQRGAVATDELGPTVEPVQLQVVCRQLWASLPPSAASIEVDDITALGNVDDALADFYVDQIGAVAQRTGVTEREIRRWFDDELISADGFRTQVLDGPGDAGPAVLRELENAHLIRADRRRGTEWYELSHDRLVAPIRASNAEWREAHLNPLQRDAQSWDRRGRPQGLLITGDVLAEAEAWARSHEPELLTVDREYLEASRAEQRRADLERKVSRRNRLLALVASGVGVLALAGLVYALNLRASAVRERHKAEEALVQQRKAEADRARLNASNAWLAAGDHAEDPRLQLLAWQAAFDAQQGGADATTGTTSVDLIRKLTTAQHYLAHDPFYDAPASALDATGTKVARGGVDGRVEIADVDTLQRRLVADVGQPVEALAFSSTEQLLAVAAGGSVSLWGSDAKVGELTAPELRGGHGVSELSLAGGADGLVAAVVLDNETDPYGRLVVWDQGRQIATPLGAEARVARVTLSPDHLAVIKEGADPTAPDALEVWRRSASGWEEQPVDEGLPPPTMRANGALTFSSDGSHLAVGATGGLQVYSLVGPGAAAPSQPTDFQDAPTRVIAAAFTTPGGDAVRTVNDAGAVVDWRLDGAGQWSPADGPQLVPSVLGAMDADGGRVLLVGARSFTVADAASGARYLGPLAATEGSTHQGRTIVVQPSEAVDEQASAGAPWSRGPTSGVVAAALSPDGQRLAKLVAPSGNLRVSAPGAAEVEQPMCDDLGAAATSAAAGTSAVPLAVGDDGAVAAAGPSSWCVLPSEGTASSFSALAGERPEAVAVSPDGRLVIVGTNLNDAGAVVDLDMRTGQQDDVPMASPVGAVAVSSDGLVVAGDHGGNLLAFQVDTAGTVATGAGVRCAVSLPTTQPVVAVSVSSSPGAESWAAAATDKSVLVYRLSMGTEPCATLIGGYDLLRDEGQVIDLSFDAQRRLTVLESDLNLFTFDPGAAAADVARNLAQGAQQRGWTLTAADCQVLLGTSACPR